MQLCFNQSFFVVADTRRLYYLSHTKRWSCCSFTCIGDYESLYTVPMCTAVCMFFIEEYFSLRYAQCVFALALMMVTESLHSSFARTVFHHYVYDCYSCLTEELCCSISLLSADGVILPGTPCQSYLP